MRPDLDEVYLRMAKEWSNRSYATRKKVGALLVKDTQIISDGYNGMPSGMPNEEIEWRVPAEFGGFVKVSSPYVIHAEANVFDKLSRYGGRGAEGATLYCTVSPCLECAKRIINNKIKRFVYQEIYRDESGLALLERNKIEIKKINHL